MNNLRIDGNYIYDVATASGGTTGNNAVRWSVSKNIIDDVSGTGIGLTNIGSLVIDKNWLTPPELPLK